MINLEYSADGKLDVAVCSPIKKERPIRVADLNLFYSNEIKLEFHAMKDLAETEAKLLSCKVARKRPNKIKNRFINTLPCKYACDFFAIIFDLNEEVFFCLLISRLQSSCLVHTS